MGPDGWVPTTLGHEVDLLTGFPFKSTYYTDSPTDLKLLRGDNIAQGQLRWDGVKRWPAKMLNGLDQYRLNAGDVVLAMDRPWIEAGLKYGSVSEQDLPCLLVQRVARLRGTRSLDTRFLRYLVGSPAFTAHVLAVQTGTAVPHISGGQIKSFGFSCPPLEEQRGIASMLSSLDGKIDLNRQMNRTLQEIARTLFRSWFVDFDPVRAKREGSHPPGLDAATAARFPDAFADSRVGPVPTGWEVAPLGDHVEVTKGLSYKGSGLAEEGLPLHNLNSIYEGGGYKHEGLKLYTGEYRDRHLVSPGDLIVANTEQGHNRLLIGYPAIIPKRYGDAGLFSHHLFRVRPLATSPLTPRHIYLALFDGRLRDDVVGYTNGTTVNMLSADGLKRPLIVVPPEPVIRAFDQVISPMLKKIEANNEDVRNLAALRDALLPKLLSGELRVNPAQGAHLG